MGIGNKVNLFKHCPISDKVDLLLSVDDNKVERVRGMSAPCPVASMVSREGYLQRVFRRQDHLHRILASHCSVS